MNNRLTTNYINNLTNKEGSSIMPGEILNNDEGSILETKTEEKIKKLVKVKTFILDAYFLALRDFEEYLEIYNNAPYIRKEHLKQIMSGLVAATKGVDQACLEIMSGPARE